MLTLMVCLLAGTLSGSPVAPDKVATASRPKPPEIWSPPQRTLAPKGAALVYQQAFDAMKDLSEDDQKIGQAFLDIRIDTPVLHLLKRLEPAFRSMYAASAIRECDWDVRLEEDFCGPLPALSSARSLARFACVRARARFAQGRAKDACADLIEALRLGRRIGEHGTALQVLVGFLIEQHCTDVIAANLPRLPAGTLLDFRKSISSLPPKPALSEVLRAERTAATVWFGRILKRDPEEARRAFVYLRGIETAFNGPVATQPASDRDSQAEVDTRFAAIGGMEKALAMVDILHADAIRIADMPLAEFRPACQALEGRRDPKNPLMFLAPDPARFRLARDRFVVLAFLLDAAIDITLQGKDALKGRVDPVLGKPLEYRPGAGQSFEIVSEVLDVAGNRVALTVGGATGLPAK